MNRRQTTRGHIALVAGLEIAMLAILIGLCAWKGLIAGLFLLELLNLLLHLPTLGERLRAIALRRRRTQGDLGDSNDFDRGDQNDVTA